MSIADSGKVLNSIMCRASDCAIVDTFLCADILLCLDFFGAFHWKADVESIRKR